MKNIYISPKTDLYRINVRSLMATSFEYVENPDDFTDASRDNATDDNTDNTVNRSNVWDNIW